MDIHAVRRGLRVDVHHGVSVLPHHGGWRDVGWADHVIWGGAVHVVGGDRGGMRRVLDVMLRVIRGDLGVRVVAFLDR